jgi:lipopolysaccharide export system protein LptA
VAHLLCKRELRINLLAPILLVGAVLLIGRMTAADTPGAIPVKSGEDNKIYITADLLISDSNAQTAEFKGNVTAKQDNTIITADTLKVFYKNETLDEDQIKADEQAIQKIIASGKVYINFDNRVAEADQAVYTTNNRVLVLTGRDTKIVSEESSVSGEKITLHRNDGRVIVERGKNRQVEMVLTSDGNGLN